jgi:hypothetical protein
MSAALRADQQKRLAQLQKALSQPAAAYSSFDAADVLLLLQHDETVRAVISGIIGEHGAITPTTAESPVAPPVPEQVARPVATPPVSALQQELHEPLAMLAVLDRHPDLLEAWTIKLEGSEGTRLVALIAYAANWDKIELLWDALAQRCKQQRRGQSTEERALLDGCLRIYNLVPTGRQAELLEAGAGTPYNFQQHERSAGAGVDIAAVWLPGLKNGGGAVRKRALVETR